MSEEHKSYGYEGGYEDWTADKVVKNMRIMQSDKLVAEYTDKNDVAKVTLNNVKNERDGEYYAN